MFHGSLSDPTRAPLPAPLLLGARDAARALGIGERTLATLTAEGSVPFVRVRGRVLYPVRGLEEWIAANQQGPRPAGQTNRPLDASKT